MLPIPPVTTKRIFLLLLLSSFLLHACRNMKNPKSENQTNQIKGPVSVADLEDTLKFPWLLLAPGDYTPDPQTLAALQARDLSSLHLVIFAGDWCSDTHYLLPRFIQLFSMLGQPPVIESVYMLDRSKSSGTGIEKQYAVEYIPVFVFMKDGKELFRITETTEKSPEQDLLGLLQKAGY